MGTVGLRHLTQTLTFYRTLTPTLALTVTLTLTLPLTLTRWACAT